MTEFTAPDHLGHSQHLWREQSQLECPRSQHVLYSVRDWFLDITDFV